MAADTQTLLSEQDAQQVNAQELLDAIADKVATKLLLKTDVVSQLVNDATKAASAAAVYALQQKLGVGDLPAGMTDVVGGISSLYSNLTSILPFNNTIKDFNDAASFGIYCGLDLKNTPKSGHVTVLTVPIGSGRSGNAGYCRQLAFPASTNMIYARYRRDGTWNQWAVLHE